MKYIIASVIELAACIVLAAAIIAYEIYKMSEKAADKLKAIADRMVQK